MSRQEADLIAVLIFAYDSTPLLIHSGGTACWDESPLRVPHLISLVAEQNHFSSALLGGRIDLDPFNTDVCRGLLIFSIRTDRIVRDGERVNHDIHSLLFTVSIWYRFGLQYNPSPTGYQLQGQAHEAATGAQQLGSQAEPQDEPHDEPHPLPQPKLHLGRRIFGQRSFGRRIFGQRNFGILKQLLPQPHPSPQLLQQAAGAQHVGSQAVPQAAGAQQLGSAATPQPFPQPAGAQQLGSAATPQPLPQPAGAQQLASTGAQQLGSTAQPQLCLWNKPACTLLAIENTTRAAESVNAFIEILLDIVL